MAGETETPVVNEGKKAEVKEQLLAAKASMVDVVEALKQKGVQVSQWAKDVLGKWTPGTGTPKTFSVQTSTGLGLTENPNYGQMQAAAQAKGLKDVTDVLAACEKLAEQANEEPIYLNRLVTVNTPNIGDQQLMLKLTKKNGKVSLDAGVVIADSGLYHLEAKFAYEN